MPAAPLFFGVSFFRTRRREKILHRFLGISRRSPKVPACGQAPSIFIVRNIRAWMSGCLNGIRRAACHEQMGPTPARECRDRDQRKAPGRSLRGLARYRSRDEPGAILGFDPWLDEHTSRSPLMARWCSTRAMVNPGFRGRSETVDSH